MSHQGNLRSNNVSVLGAASARQQLKRLAIFSRQFDRLRLSSSTHPSKLTSSSTLMKANSGMLY
jgi:hypothetical protein